MPRSRDEILAVVERSAPRPVAVHDRTGWIDLFVDEAHIEDSVGRSVPKAAGVLGRFWDTFIGPHEIAFEIRRDHLLGLDVMRDAMIHTRIGPHIEIDVPAYHAPTSSTTAGTPCGCAA